MRDATNKPPADLATVTSLLKQLVDVAGANAAEALDANAAARLAGVSRSKWYDLHTRGLCPASVDVGETPRWLRSEILSWLKSGAPARSRWMMMRESVMRKAI